MPLPTENRGLQLAACIFLRKNAICGLQPAVVGGRTRSANCGMLLVSGRGRFASCRTPLSAVDRDLQLAAFLCLPWIPIRSLQHAFVCRTARSATCNATSSVVQLGLQVSEEVQNMFSTSTEIYDIIYTRVKNYKEEVGKLIDWIKRFRPDAKSILDVACGTGEHDRFLSAEYPVDGIDLNPEFIEIARSKNPRGEYRVADMINFDLGKRYDVLLCLFSAIGYVQTLENLQETIGCFNRHLEEGGIIIVEPWFTPDTWKSGLLHMTSVDEDQLKVCRMNISETRDGRLSCFTFHYLLGTPNGVEHFTENHSLGLFSIEEMKAAFMANGLTVQYDEPGIAGRGLYFANRG
jgi:ubiquinone/menaquinone biosynthesis C-methylase UbiE